MIHPGELLAIVGTTGHGRSMLVQLLTRFYDADADAVFLDGQDIRSFAERSLRSHIGVVLQDNAKGEPHWSSRIGWKRSGRRTG